MNQVDCSPELVAREWHRIRDEHKVTPPKQYEVDVDSGSTGEGEYQATEEPQSLQTKHEMLTKLISKGMGLVFFKLFKLPLPDDVFDEFAGLTAEMVIKYHPNMHVLEIIAKYEREIAWAWSVAVLGSALVQGFKLRAEEKRLEKQGQLGQPSTSDKQSEAENDQPSAP